MTNFAIDLYCERVDASFWAEPFNAITNLAFIIAALVAIQLHKNKGGKEQSFFFLSFLVACIGLGSFLFHTFANSATELADTIPIWLFVVCYLYYVNRLVFEQSFIMTLRNMTIILALSMIGFLMSQTNTLESEPAFLNGSLQYAPALFFLLVYTYFLYHKDKQLFMYAFYASLTFIGSLCFRTLDLLLCSQINVGLHFMWHILNALMLFLLLYILHCVMIKKSINES